MWESVYEAHTFRQTPDFKTAVFESLNKHLVSLLKAPQGSAQSKLTWDINNLTHHLITAFNKHETDIDIESDIKSTSTFKYSFYFLWVSSVDKTS